MSGRPEKRITIKSVVAAGAAAGHSIEQIAETLVTTFPGSKAAEKPDYYVKYYLNDLKHTPTTRASASGWRQPESKIVDRTPLPNLDEIMGNVVYGELTSERHLVVPIYRSLVKTCRGAREKLTVREVITAYEFMTDSRIPLDASMAALREAVVGDVQNHWYLITGKPLPPKVEESQAQRLEDAKMAKKTEETTTSKTKEPRVTVKSVIVAGLLAGRGNDEIGADIKEQFPDTAAAREPAKHIAFYRSHLVKAGELEKQPRQPRAAKEPAAEVEAPKGKKAAAAPVKAAVPAKKITGKKGK